MDKEIQKGKMENKYTPTVETQMLIRKPINEVFQAFINSLILTLF